MINMKFINSSIKNCFFAIFVTICLSFNYGNIVRFPTEIALYGATPYTIVHLILSILITTPLVFHELILGALTEEIGLGIWRAVPFFKGIGVLKCVTCFLYSMYIILNTSLCMDFIIFIINGPLPFLECRDIHMVEDGYQNNAVGLECLNRTFLKPLQDQPLYYGVTILIVFITWITIAAILYNGDYSFKPTISILSSSIIILSLTYYCIHYNSLISLYESDIKWDVMLKPRIWYSALIQVFVSNFIGFGFLTIASSTLYTTIKPLWTSILITITNYIMGWLFVLYWNGIIHNVAKELSVFYLILIPYDLANSLELNFIWPIVNYIIIMLSGFVTVSVLFVVIFSTLKSKFYIKWIYWVTLIVMFGILCSGATFLYGYNTIQLLDIYYIPMYLMLCIVMEIICFNFIYKWKSYAADIQFITNKKTSPYYLCVWILSIIYIISVATWTIVDIYMNGWMFPSWCLWLTCAMAILSIVIILGTGFIVVIQKDEYDFISKLISSFRPSMEWGPKSPRRRQIWFAWKSNTTFPYILNLVHNSSITKLSRSWSPYSESNDDSKPRLSNLFFKEQTFDYENDINIRPNDDLATKL